MAGLKQSKRVSWAKELHQVRLFLAEDAPALSGLGTQDNLQAKGSWLLHATSIGHDDSSLPPGFEAPHPAYQFRSEISQIPLVKWKCPLKTLLNPEWLVVAGEESAEVAVQNQRQVRVLEAIYPRLSSVPPNPSVSSEVQDSFYDDSQTPVIPITGIEDEDSSEQLETAPPTATSTRLPLAIAQNLQGMNRKHDLPNLKLARDQFQGHVAQPAPSMPRGETGGILAAAEPDVVAAASAAFTAIMKSSEEGSMIDRDLLINILSNPSLVEKLVSDYGAHKQAQAPLAPISVAPPRLPVPVHPPAPAPAPPAPPPLPQINTSSPSPLSIFQTPQMYGLPGSVPPLQAVNPHALLPVQIPVKPLASGQAVVKDANYFKSLVQQHGGEKQDAADLNLVHAMNYQNNVVPGNAVDLVSYGPKQQREARPKIPKPCAYFNTPKGCRHGASCSYQHDPSLPQRIEQPKGSKRIKLDRGIANRN